jgi:hypothetical protein
MGKMSGACDASVGTVCDVRMRTGRSQVRTAEPVRSAEMGTSVSATAWVATCAHVGYTAWVTTTAPAFREREAVSEA